MTIEVPLWLVQVGCIVGVIFLVALAILWVMFIAFVWGFRASR